MAGVRCAHVDIWSATPWRSVFWPCLLVAGVDRASEHMRGSAAIDLLLVCVPRPQAGTDGRVWLHHVRSAALCRGCNAAGLVPDPVLVVCVCARVLPFCNSPTECLLELVQTGVEMGCNLVMWWVMRNIMYQRPHIRDGIKGSLTSGDTVAAALLSMTLIVGVMTFATSRVSNTASMPMVIEMFAGIETIVTAVLVAVSAVLFIAGCRAASVPTQFVRVAVVRWPLPAVWWLADKGLLVVYLRGGSAGPRQHQSSGGNAPATTPGAELVPRRVPQH